METVAVEEMGAAEALHAFGDLRRARDRAERDLLRLAAHFADLYNVDADAPNRHTLPGTERPVAVGGDGAPRILEFAIAEAAAELGTTSHSTKRLIGDALDLRHRLPRLWARVDAEEVPAWRGRKVAQATRQLSRTQAGLVDEEIHEVADGRLPYRQFITNLEAAVVAADPEAAAARERAAATQTFAKVGQANQHGTKTLYVKTSAAAMARIDATIAYLADALAYFGDTSNEDTRRTTAVLLLANPTEALTLLQALVTAATNPETSNGTSNGTTAEANTGQRHRGQYGTTGSGRPYRDDETPLPDPDPDPDADDGTAAPANPAGSSEPPEPGQSRDQDGGPPASSPLDRINTPFHPGQVPPCPCRGGNYTYDPRRLLPKVPLPPPPREHAPQPRSQRRPLGRREPDHPRLRPRLPRPCLPLRRQTRHRPCPSGTGRRVRDPSPAPRGSPPPQPQRRLPLRAQHHPQQTARPHHPLRARP